ncbi:hypothetical protein [Anaeromicrobium sediminis]|uniref:DUF5673 domain-containing protein n=1 Tax=Anaeromicrobium sediminis TaxID=1478221 RepID=A0A267ML03_9FIRM|nr:hypothetical protein [Anaeromicrobium sediminis]PAB60269.1 hypothetical protein CCE28_05045 [Anaeromicrobium sediminis]
MITILFITFNIILIYFYLIRAEIRRRSRGEILVSNGNGINHRLFMGISYVIISVLLFLKTSNIEQFSIRMGFFFCGVVWLYKGLLKTQLCENGIYTPEYIINWEKIKNYKWISNYGEPYDLVEFDVKIFKGEKKVIMDVERIYKEYVEEFLSERVKKVE